MKKVFKAIWKGIKGFIIIRIIFGFLYSWFSMIDLYFGKLNKENKEVSQESMKDFLNVETESVFTGTFRLFGDAWDKIAKYINRERES